MRIKKNVNDIDKWTQNTKGF